MLNCEDFRFQSGADPGHLTWRLRLHRLMCRACAQYLRSMQALDERISKALDIELPRDRRNP